MDDTPRSALGGRAPIHLSAVSQLHVLLHVAYFLSYHTVGYRDPTIVYTCRCKWSANGTLQWSDQWSLDQLMLCDYPIPYCVFKVVNVQ